MRLDKYLSFSLGISRLEAKYLIKDKRVYVGTELIRSESFSLDENKAEVFVDGKKVVYQKNYYILLNKPEGYICSNVAEHYPSVLELLPDEIAKRVFTIGRLDYDTTGVLLLTDDGTLCHNLISPKKGIKKVYHATINHEISDKLIPFFAEGFDLGEGEMCKPSELKIIAKNEALLTLIEGKYHQVKRMFKHFDLEVVKLNRVSFATITIEGLKMGEYRLLSEEEVGKLQGGDDEKN